MLAKTYSSSLTLGMSMFGKRDFTTFSICKAEVLGKLITLFKRRRSMVTVASKTSSGYLCDYRYCTILKNFLYAKRFPFSNNQRNRKFIINNPLFSSVLLQNLYKNIYNFRSSRLKSFPELVLGTPSTKTTPPVNLL